MPARSLLPPSGSPLSCKSASQSYLISAVYSSFPFGGIEDEISPGLISVNEVIFSSVFPPLWILLEGRLSTLYGV